MSSTLPLRRPAARTAAALWAVLWAALLAACGPSDPVAGPAARYGEVRGAVTVVGDLLPPGLPGSQAYLLPGPDAAKAEAVRRAPITGGPRAFAFAIDSVPPGRYYVLACVELGAGAGCAPYQLDPRAGPAPVDVRAGAVTSIDVRY